MKKIFFIILILVLTTASCSVFNRVNVNGTYRGTIEGTQDSWPFSMTLTITLNQAGKQVNGTWNTSGGTSGSISGEIQGDNIRDFTVTQTSPCSGTFTGSAIVYDKGEEIRGNYHGSSCYGYVSATFEVYK